MRRWSRWALVVASMFLATEIVALSTATEAHAQRRRGRGSRRAQPTPPPSQSQSSFRGPTRIDFDDRLIQGQTNKSGAVYLFSRKETNISSMVRRRKSFRHLTIRTIYDR